MSLEFLEQENEITKDNLKTISELCYKQKKLEEKADKEFATKLEQGLPNDVSIDTLEEILKARKEKLRKIKQEQIPALLNNVGLQELKLKTGEKVIVEDKVKPNVTKANIEKVFVEMVNLEVEIGADKEQAKQQIKSLFKENLLCEATEENMVLLLKNNIIFDKDMSIHYQTLAKYCKDKLAAGLPLPKDISVFQYQETKIK